MPDNIIKEQIATLNPRYREFILSGEVGAIVEPFIKHHNLDEDKEVMLENGFVLYLIFLFTFDNFVNFLKTELDFTEKEASLLAHGLKLALPKPIGEYLDNQSLILFAEIEEEEETPTIIENETKEAVVTPSAPASKPIINPLRTMATDGKGVGYESVEEPVYTSVQNAIINESRWGSDDNK